MTPQRMVGIVVLVVGIVIMVVDMNASHSVADSVKHGLTGRFTQETALYIFGGLAAIVLGFLMMIFGAGGKQT
jgi:hypothetical protein